MSARGLARALRSLAVPALLAAGHGSAVAQRSPSAILEWLPTAPSVATAWPESVVTALWITPAPMVGAAAGKPTAAGSLAAHTGQIDGEQVLAGRVEGAVRLPLSPRMSAELRTGLLAQERTGGFERRGTRTEARLLTGGEARNAWFGLAVESDARVSGPLVALGGSSRAGPVRLSASLVQTMDRLGTLVRDSLKTSIYETRFTATTALLSGRWAHRRLAVETQAGVSVSRILTPSWWSQTAAALALAPRLSLLATVGRPGPRWLALDQGSAARATLGLRLTTQVDPSTERERGRPSEPGWRLRHLGKDWYVVEIRADYATDVAVMGDFTEWSPVVLRQLTGSRWALAFQLTPGVHQVQVRVDGGPWEVPAGLPASADGFSGSAGVFVAE